MGQMIALRLRADSASQKILFLNQHPKKTALLAKKHHFTRATSIADLIQKSEIIFICVKPQNLNEVLSKIKTTKHKTFITIVAAIPTTHYYQTLGPIELIWAMPSIVNTYGGALPTVRGRYVRASTWKVAQKVLSSIATVTPIKESDMAVTTLITGCSTTLIAEFARLLLEAITSLHPLNKTIATKLLLATLIASPKLVEDKGFALIDEACTAGGITEQGVKIMRAHQDTFFQALAERLLTRTEELRKTYGA